MISLEIVSEVCLLYNILIKKYYFEKIVFRVTHHSKQLFKVGVISNSHGMQVVGGEPAE